MEYLIGFTIALISVSLGYIIGKDDKFTILEKQKEPIKELPKMYMDEPKTQQANKELKKQLGAVHRPTAEDLERKKNPKIVEEEEAWDEDITKIFNNPHGIAIATR